MPDLIHIHSRSAGKHWPEVGQMILAHQLAPWPDLFGQNLTQSARTKSDQGWFCTVLSRTSVKERNRIWKLETGSGPVASRQKPGQMIPADQLASRQMRLAKPWWGHPDRIWVGFAQYDPCLLWKNGAEMDAGSWIWHILSRWILAITKTLPDRISMFTGMLLCTAMWLMFSHILISWMR